jgi:outer membrane protein assembly factor BamC
MYRMIFSRVALVAVVTSVVVVSGCTWTGSSVSQTVDYQNARTRSTPLEVPPDLSQLPRDERFTVPERPQTVTASSTAASRPGGAAGAPGAAAAAMVAPTATVARIERAGNQRWLAVNMPPDKAWPILLEFWPSVGLAVEKSDPATGVMETVWAENKAKVNQDLIRRSLGRLFSSVYETGEQDKYRARVERTATDTSEIYISHRGMIEVFTSSQQDRTAWQPRPPDPGLEAEMLQRLLLQRRAPQPRWRRLRIRLGSSRAPTGAANDWSSMTHLIVRGDASDSRSIAAASRSRIATAPRAPISSAISTPTTRRRRRMSRAS